MTQRLFGTDGVRGRAGEPPLDAPTIERLGAAVVKALPFGAAHRLLIGRDTRESGTWMETALARGARAAGARVTSAGVVPTPMVAYLTKSMEFDAGFVISASHNPFEDNGIKVFSGEGEKFAEDIEDRIADLVADRSWSLGPDTGPPIELRDFLPAYIAHARCALPDLTVLRRSRIVVDCANGATSAIAPRIFRDLGFDVTTIFGEPDGRNINLGCGSTHLEPLRQAVVDGGFRLGIAFDGDGDRCLLVDHTGRVVDGDAIMLMCAKHLKRHGELKGGAVVATVMSNIGLEIALRDAGIDLVRTQVGDKYVMEQLLARGLSLGGEQSGHVIFTDFLSTGDGIVTALSVLRVMSESGRELSELAGEFVAYPQVLVNVRVPERRAIELLPGVGEAIERVEARLGSDGRLLVRYSGTEPLLRIMLEGRDHDEIAAWADEIADALRRSFA